MVCVNVEDIKCYSPVMYGNYSIYHILIEGAEIKSSLKDHKLMSNITRHFWRVINTEHHPPVFLSVPAVKLISSMFCHQANATSMGRCGGATCIFDILNIRRKKEEI